MSGYTKKQKQAIRKQGLNVFRYEVSKYTPKKGDSHGVGEIIARTEERAKKLLLKGCCFILSLREA